jgi:serine/threonine protein kinase
MPVTPSQRVIAGRYRLIVPIGSGGAGVVWKAEDDLLSREVAVKEIVRLAEVGEQARAESYQRTLREARAAARISHPGVAAVYDVVSEDDCPFIVMQLIGGRPLSQVIDEGPLPPAQVADVGRQVLDALRAGHAVGVLHRDLKPSNVLITPSGQAVLTDFGIATLAGDPSITRTGVVLGTPGYVSPERVTGEPATAAADLWSLGATLYAAACGHGPYDGHDDVMATMYAIATTDPPELPVGGPLRSIIGALLSRDPRQRPTAAEAAIALESVGQPVLSAPITKPDRAAGSDIQSPPASWLSQLSASAPVTSARKPWVHSPTVTSELLVPSADEHDERPAPRFRARPTPPASPPIRSRRPRPANRQRRPRSRDRQRRYGRRAVALAVAAAGVAAIAIVAATLSLGGNPPKYGAAAHATVPAVTQQFRVATAVDADGSTTELFARAKNGSLMRDAYANGTWSGWTALPGGNVFTGVPAVAKDRTGRLVVFARQASGRLGYLWQSLPGSSNWDGPQTLGTTEVTSDPAVIAWPDGHLEVFARTTSGGLGTISQNGAGDAASTGWSGLASLGGSLAGPPAVGLDSTGHPQAFWVTKAGGLAHDYYQGGSWAGSTGLPGGNVFTGVPAVGANADGRLEVFVRTLTGNIEHVWQSPDNLAQWAGAPVLIYDVLSDPAVFSANGGRMEVFAVARNGQMMHTWQNQPVAGTMWAHPLSLAGKCLGAPSVIRVGIRSELFMRGTDGTIGYDHLDHSTGAWASWSGINGTFEGA